jgi:hypothetical protein
MKQNWKSLFFGFTVIGIIGFLIILIIIKISGFVSGLDNKTGPAVVGGSIAILLALFAFWREVRKSRREAHRDKKVEIYSIFSGLIFKMLRNIQKGEGISEITEADDFVEQMYKLKEGIIFYGSPKVINTFSKWLRDSEQASERSLKEVLQGIGDVLLAMRNDLGLSNFGLNNVNIHQIYVTDDLTKL